MLRSMTAYGRGKATSNLADVVVELSSVNGRHFEVQIVAPPELARFEADMRRTLAHRFARGRLRLRVTLNAHPEGGLALQLNKPLLHQLKNCWLQAAEAVGADRDAASRLQLLAQHPEIFQTAQLSEEDEASTWKLLEEAIDTASDAFRAMREEEGRWLYDDLAARCDSIRTLTQSIAELAPTASEQYRQKLLDRLQEMAGDEVLAPDVVREIAVYADKVDITEEITRSQSHLKQLLSCLEVAGEVVGKKLDFLLQELNREANTILSKTTHPQVTGWAVEMKAEIEKMREQVQNVE